MSFFWSYHPWSYAALFWHAIFVGYAKPMTKQNDIGRNKLLCVHYFSTLAWVSILLKCVNLWCQDQKRTKWLQKMLVVKNWYEKWKMKNDPMKKISRDISKIGHNPIWWQNLRCECQCQRQTGLQGH